MELLGLSKFFCGENPSTNYFRKYIKIQCKKCGNCIYYYDNSREKEEPSEKGKNRSLAFWNEVNLKKVERINGN